MIPDDNWGIILSNNSSLIQKIFEKSKPLEEVAKVNATSTAAESDKYSELISENGTGLPLINTGTIDRYSSKYGLSKLTAKARTLRLQNWI